MRVPSILVAGLALLLAGCFELVTEAKVQESGAVQVEVEFALSLQLAALASGLSKDGQGKDPLEDCGKAPESPRAGVKVIRTSRGVRNEMMTCTIVGEIADPVKTLPEVAAEFAKPDGPLIMKGFKIERIDDRGYRLSGRVETNPAAIKAEEQNPFAAMMLASMANRYITIKVSGQRVENTAGQVSPDGKTVEWRIPVLMVIKPMAGYQQDLRADVIYRESWLEKAKRFIGLN